MSGSIFALCIDPCLRRLLACSLVDLARLTSCLDDLAIVFANLWAYPPSVAAGFAHWAAASHTLSVAECAVVSLWCFTDVEVEVGVWLGASGWSVRVSARDLGVELRPGLRPGSWERQLAAAAATLLRHTRGVLNAGEALGF